MLDAAYACQARTKPGRGLRCNRVSAPRLDAGVLAEVARVLGGPDVAEAFRRELVRESMRTGTAEVARAAVLLDERLAGRLTGEQFGQANAREVREQERIRGAISAAEAAMLALRGGEDVSALVEKLRDFTAVEAALEPVERRTLL